jgi:hypothetical protein
MPLRDELVTAGTLGAAGVIIMFDVEREQVESYFEPHQGVHYKLPAMYVGADEALLLKDYAGKGASATLTIRAEATKASTRNLFATLPGQVSERIIFDTHTDGNTFVQENGPVALLALARYYASLPITSRRRTIEFAFNTGHLHISREGTQRHAEQLNREYGDKQCALVIPMEHLGTREIEAYSRANGKPGRALSYTGKGELMFWCVGPSPPVVAAVIKAVKRRQLDRVLVTRGTAIPKLKQSPQYGSFGGIGSYYHNLLVPTTSLISGPWSLWAPSFGEDAVDVARLRSQTLALGDLYLELEGVTRDEIVAGYGFERERRAKGAPAPASFIPEEVA